MTNIKYSYDIMCMKRNWIGQHLPSLWIWKEI